MIGSSLHRLGNINFETGNNTFALEYYRLSIPHSKQAKNDFKLSETFLDIAKLFEKKLHQTVLEINLNALAHNLKQYQKIIAPSTKIVLPSTCVTPRPS